MRHNWAMVHPSGKIAWVPVLRNGNRYYKGIFGRMQWQLKQFGQYNKVEKIFCHVRHPKERLIRGIASVIVNFHDPQIFLKINIEQKTALMYLKLFHDDHVYPISYQFNEFFDKLDCIHLTHDKYSSEQLTEKYLRKNGFNVDITTNVTGHNVTGGVYLEVQNKLRNLLETKQGSIFYKDYLAAWMQHDYELYKRADLNV